MKICRLGHVYDEEKHEACPMCGFVPKSVEELEESRKESEEK